MYQHGRFIVSSTFENSLGPVISCGLNYQQFVIKSNSTKMQEIRRLSPLFEDPNAPKGQTDATGWGFVALPCQGILYPEKKNESLFVDLMMHKN